MGAELIEVPSNGLDGITAVVLTHMRPRLASQTVRSLIEDEGFSPSQVVVVVNGDGGLDDPRLEESVRMVRLSENFGPAGGFRQALIEAFAEQSTTWAYVCEDDMTLLHLPAPRLGGLLRRVAEFEETSGPTGAVVPFGRMFMRRSGHTVNVVPRRGLPGELAAVDVSTWGATLVSRRVYEAGVLPDPELFFGFEDFDFFSSTRRAGFSVLVDVPCARRVAHRQTLAARDESLRRHRPIDSEEPWRAYYFARNFFALARRYGRRSWMGWHLVYSLRRLQLAGGSAERAAILHGLADGIRGRLGMNPAYLRTVGERAEPTTAVTEVGDQPARPKSESVSESETKAPVVALVLTHNAPMALRRCLEAIAAQTVPPSAVIVVDNATNPPVGNELSTSELPVSVIRSDVNLGPAGGWAMAFSRFRASSFDFAWVLDDDIVPDPECLEVLLDEAAPDPKGAFLFPWAVQPDGSVRGMGIVVRIHRLPAHRRRSGCAHGGVVLVG